MNELPMNPNPSAEAIALAVKLSPHKHCECAWNKRGFGGASAVCDGCLCNAAIIDRELQLPQCNAALALARKMVDARRRRDNTADLLDNLDRALAAIKTK